MPSPPSSPQFHSQGAGEPVLMLHGLGATSAVFDGVRRELGPGFRTITVDLPHHGQGGAWSLLEPRAVAAQLSALIDAESFYVVGHSFGGVAALELAAAIPSRVRGACVIAAPAMGLGRFSGALDSRFADWTMRVASHVRPSAAAVRTYLRFIWGSGAAPTAGQIQGYLMAMDAEGHHDATLHALRALAKYELPAEALKAAAMPISLLFGERDPLVPPREAQKLSRALCVDVELLKGAGHCVPEERPAEVAAIIRREHARSLHRTA